MSVTGSESDGSFQACSQLLAGDLFLSYLPPECLILLCSAVRGALHSGRHRVVPPVQCAQTHTCTSPWCVLPGSDSIAVIGQKEKGKNKKQQERREPDGYSTTSAQQRDRSQLWNPPQLPPESPTTGLSRMLVCLNWRSTGRWREEDREKEGEEQGESGEREEKKKMKSEQRAAFCQGFIWLKGRGGWWGRGWEGVWWWWSLCRYTMAYLLKWSVAG